jgi:hypothetical protein
LREHSERKKQLAASFVIKKGEADRVCGVPDSDYNKTASYQTPTVGSGRLEGDQG